MSAIIDIDLTTPNNLHRLLLPHSSISAESIEFGLRTQIVSTLWNLPKEGGEHDAYFQFFASECDRWRLSGRPVAIDTYGDFLDLVKHLKRHRTLPRLSATFLGFFPPISEWDVYPPFLISPESNSRLDLPLAQRYSCCTKASVTNSLEITLSLWLMISEDTFTPINYADGEIVFWHDDWSLDDFVRKTLPTTVENNDQSYFQWDTAFNLNSIEGIGGFDIFWTNVLEDRLFLDERFGKTLHIYHYASVLQNHCKDTASSSDGVLPKAFLDETLQTLARLLPRSKHDSKVWFGKQQKLYPGIIDPVAGDLPLQLRRRRRTSYPYWHERLSIIQDAFHSSEPEGLSRLWHDRRKKVQWYTFWVAILIFILTVVFGFIQSITSIMQVSAAYHPVAPFSTSVCDK